MTRETIERLINEQESIIIVNNNALKDEDYKVIKCAEAKVQGKTMPYDTNELFARRNDYRKAINDAQTRIEELKAVEPEEVTNDEEVVE